jgi:cytoskeleton protein RodZ
VLGAILTVAVLLGAYEFYMNPDLFKRPEEQSSAPPRSVAAPAQPERSSELVQVPAPAAEQGATGPSASVEDQGAGPVSATVAEAAGESAGEPTSSDQPPIAAAASGQGIVRLRFERDSWVEIKDRDGNRILNQLNKAGTERSVQGIPPLRLVIGAASGVKVEWNEQPVDLAPYTKVDVARFTVE